MSQDPLVGKLIDNRYEIMARIGEGGMGVVYKARQATIDRVIALKMLNSQMAADPTWVQRFYNEARACARLQHPNTIRMFDFGQAPDGRLFMTMEFLDGLSLRESLAKGPLAAHRVAKILIQCCASLAEAHSIGIIHRDIKPDNVFLLNMAGVPDFVKLLDFSVAKLLEGDRMKTQAGVVFGTPQYMSPEQGRGLPLDARSDLYALGVLAYEMLTGNVPFHDENPMTVIHMHLQAPVPPLPQSIPYSMQQVVRRALEKEPNRRYQSSGEMMQHCQQVFAELAGGGVSVGGAGVPRTMIAGPGMGPGIPGMVPPGMAPPGLPGMPPPGLPGMAPPGLPGMPPGPPGGQGPPAMPPGMAGGVQASPQQKTMIAAPSPFAGGQMPGMPPGGQMPGMPPGGFNQSSPMQKTIVAGMAPPMGGGMPGHMQPGQMQPGHMQPGQMPGHMQPGGPGGFPPQMHGMPPGGAAAGGPAKTVMLQPSEGVVSVARTGHAVQPAAGGGALQQGASTLFWIVSLVIGVAVGALAYVIVLQL